MPGFFRQGGQQHPVAAIEAIALVQPDRCFGTQALLQKAGLQGAAKLLRPGRFQFLQ